LPRESPLSPRIEVDLADAAATISRIELGEAGTLFVEQQAVKGRVLQELTGNDLLPRMSPVVVQA
jgi:hypothetical protein